VAKPPEAVSDDDVRRYFLYLREDKKLAPSSITIAVCALRFFFQYTLGRDSEVFDLLRVNRPRRLPVVLSRAEIRAIVCSVRHPVRRMALTTIYALGLRLGEGLALQSGHIDGERLVVSVRNGKGARDRSVPLPRSLLARLRTYWKRERPSSPTKYLFVSEGGDVPLHETTLQKTFSALAETPTSTSTPRFTRSVTATRHTWSRAAYRSGPSSRSWDISLCKAPKSICMSRSPASRMSNAFWTG
jgi:integrase/recombinase XerD